MRSIWGLLGVGLFYAASSQAQVYELSFTDTSSQARAVKSSTEFINPTSAIKVKSLAGLDRYLRLTVVNADSGATIFDSKSSMITVSDRLTSTADGSEFYGKEFTVPVLSEGHYTFTSFVYDINNALVNQVSNVYVVDTTKLSAKSFGWNAWAHPSNDLPDNRIIAPYEQYKFWVNINDDVSGIKSAVFEGRSPITGEAYVFFLACETLLLL